MPTRRVCCCRASRYDEGVAILKGIYEGVAPGDPQDPATLCGPVISDKQRSRIRGYIQKGVDEGATLLVGGAEQPDGFDKGFFVKPTLFVDVDNSMTIAQEEIFGPVLVVIPYDDEDDAVRIANDSRYGLAGNVMSSSLDHALAVARRLRAGFIGLNGAAGYGADTPFGGYKYSGVGRQNGVAGFDQYTEIKSVAYPAAERSSRMQLFDDLEDFGAFDDFVSGDVRDPYTELARLRREEPVQRIDIPGMPREEGKPIVMVYRYEDAQQMLRDNETFSSAIIIQAFGDVFGEHVMLGMDEPEHGRHRALVSKAFSQKALARWEDELVGRVGNELIDRVRRPGPRRSGEGVHLSLSHADHRRSVGPAARGLPAVSTVVDLVAVVHRQPRARSSEHPQALAEYFAPILAARRKEPRDDLISGLAAAEIDGERLSDEEIFSFLRLLLPAGVETTYRALGNLLFALLSDPDQLEAVRADRSLSAAGDRGSSAVGAAADHDHTRGHPRHRTRRSPDPRRLVSHAGSGCGQPAGRALCRSEPFRHLPRVQTEHRMGARCPRVPRHAPRAPGDASGAEPAVRPTAESAPGSRRQMTRTSAVRPSAPRRRCRSCFDVPTGS